MIAEAAHRGAPVDPDGLRVSARVYAAYQRTLLDANAADRIDDCPSDSSGT